ncbi:MAG: hypothetical protein IMZ70_07730 [Candidatus Atribacteria bacterium]|nr:hypothetical protein [Candidatus Atribacteria bacterium]
MREREQTRVREQGTVVTNPKTGIERIDAIRQIVTEKQYAKVDGVMVDLFSASAIINVYDNINGTHQAKYRELPVQRMVDIAFKVMDKV